MQKNIYSRDLDILFPNLLSEIIMLSGSNNLQFHFFQMLSEGRRPATKIFV